MVGASSLLTPRFWTRAWPYLAVVLLAIQAGLLFVVKPGASLSAYTNFLDIVYLLVLLLATGLAILNALGSRQAIRLFWALFALGCGAWTFNAWSWVYYIAIMGKKNPDFLLSRGPLYLHIVFLIAAVAVRPHLKLSRLKPYRTTLNLLLLLFCSAFAYALVIFPVSYMQYDSAHILRGQVLYSAENLLLIAVLGAVVLEARPPWKAIYWHMLGASGLYAVGSTATSVIMASGKLTAGWHNVIFTAAAYWFVWVVLQGRERAAGLAETVQIDTINPKYASTLAMLVVITIPVVGMWELLRTDQPYATRVTRLLIVFFALLFLAVTAFITESFTKRELSSDVDLARDRLRLAMASSKSVGWDWDLVSGRDTWFGDLKTMFGISSDTYSGRAQEFYRYVHPDDRQRVSEAVTNARVNHSPYEAEFRVVRQDGTLRWVAARGMFYYAKNGEPERMLGMSVDITERKQAEVALKNSEEKFSTAFRESPLAITLTSAKDHHYIDVNETFEQITGWRRDEVIGRTPFELGIWVDPAQRVELAKRILSESSARDIEVNFRCKDGTRRIGFASAELIEIDNEPCMLSVIADITDSKEVQRQLQESQERLRGIVASAMDAIIAVDEGQQIVLFNTAAEKMFGCASQEAVGTAIERFIPQRFRSAHETHIRRFAESGVTTRVVDTRGTLSGLRANGEEFPIEASISHVKAGGSNLFTVIIRDITVRLRMEEAQRQSEERLHLAVQAGRMYAYEWDAKSDLVVRSPEYTDVLGTDQPKQTSRRDLLAEVHPDDRMRVEESCAGTTVQYPTSQISYRVTRPNGSVIWLEKRARAFFDDQGKLLRTVGVVVDITERKQADEALQASEERYRHLVDSSNDWVWEVDADGVYTYAGPQCLEILGYEPSELIGKKLFDLMPPEESRRVAAMFNAIAAERKTFRGLENTNLHKDGRLVVVETNGAPVVDGHGRLLGYRGMDRDITLRKQVENVVRESEERFRLVANTAPVMIWTSGTDKLCTYVNQPWLEFTGRPLKAELGSGWGEGVHPDDVSRCMATYTQAFDRRESFQVQYRLRRHDGEYRWVLDIGVPRFNQDGSFAGYIGSCLDITDQKLAEETLASVSRRLIEAHEQERTWIARELHDDINQQLALLSIEFERWGQQLPGSTVDLNAHIRHASHRLSEIAKEVQSLSHRLHSSKLEYLGIVTAAKSFCKELSEQQKVEIEFTHANIPHTVPNDIALCLFRVLQEALQNAVKHSRARRFRVELHATPGDISLTVSDPGVGFDWHGAVNRQGLGLISMRERLQLVNGEFTIESEPGQGTTIHARVPLRAEEHRIRAVG